MAPSDVCPTEDAVQIFLEHLVDPLLPEKASVRDNPTLPQQQSIAKQVHSVVLLYNYYHRKRHPELEYLPLNEFCKLAVVLRQPLLAYMQFMQMSNNVELTDVEKQLSLTEKMIMDACDVCKCLDASKNVRNTEGWPISKVAILLVDSKKECCFLRFGSITDGIWSVVEKGLDNSSQSSEVTSETKDTSKRRRIIRKPTKDELKVDDAKLLQVGYSAVKEATDINNTDIMLLESHTVYSQSKEKAATRFYIMQCSQSINQEVIKTPLKDVIARLQGPLVKKSSSSWTITPVVEYLHVLPYSEIILKWISREEFPNSLQDMMVDSLEVTESYVSKDMSTGLDHTPSKDNIKSLEQKEKNGICTLGPSDSIKEPHEMNVDKSSIYPSQNKGKCQNISNTKQIDEDEGENSPSVQYNSNGSASAVQHLCTSLALLSKDTCHIQNETSHHCQPPSARPLFTNSYEAMKVDSTRVLVNEGVINNVASCNKLCSNKPNISYEKVTTGAHTQSANNSNSDAEKSQILLDSKKTLSQTALAALIQKRNELALQHRELADGIAIYDKKIERLLTVGEDDFELKIESIEGCNDIVTNQERIYEHQSFPLKKEKLSEAIFTTQSPCQELDAICDENNWDFPTHHLSQSDGGFQANVTLTGIKFRCSKEGNVCSTPNEARESAAAQMLTILRSITKLVK